MLHVASYPGWGFGTVRILLFFFASAAGAVHAEPEANSITSAKKDYELIKEVARDANSPTTAPAKQSVPSLELPSDRAPALSPMQRARLLESSEAQSKPKPTGGWLVDAINRKEILPNSRDTERFKNPKDPSETSLLRLAERDDDRANQKPINEPAIGNEAQALKVANPLESYMASWMSARDLQLFQAASKPDEVVLGGITPLPDSTKISLSQPVPPELEKPISERLETNPYLVESAPIVPMPAVQLAKPVSPAAAQSKILSPATEGATNTAATSQTLPSDKLRTTDDARYFKQLKRF